MRGLEWTVKQAPPPAKNYRYRWQGMELDKGYLEAWRNLLYPGLPRPTLLPYPGAASATRPLAETLVAPETEEDLRATLMSMRLG